MSAPSIPLLILVITTLYLGPGLFASWFLRSHYRNNPLLWLLLSIVLGPVVIAGLAAFGGSYIAAVTLCGAFLVAGIVLRFVPVGHPTLTIDDTPLPGRKRDIWLITGILLAFGIALLVPKLSLLLSTDYTGDDYWRVAYVVSMGSDLSHPRHFQWPSMAFVYYYYDYLLPGIVFRLTDLTARQAWFIHGILEYTAVLWWLQALARGLLRTTFARTWFLLGVTFAGGFDYFVYLFQGKPIEPHLEWWSWITPVASGLSFQISAFFTTFIYAPHHLLGAIIAVSILQLRTRTDMASRIGVAILFASLLGFSTFIFFVTAIAYAALEIARVIRTGLPIRAWLVQAWIVSFLCLPLLPLIGAKRGIIGVQPLAMHLLTIGPSWLRGAVNYVLSLPIILFIDIGISTALAVLCLVLVRRYGSRVSERFRFLLPTITAAAVMMLVTLSFLRSDGLNELLMRGMLVTQIIVVLTAAAVFDATAGRWRNVLIAAAALSFGLQLSHAQVEIRNRSTYGRRPTPALYEFLASHTPKDAVIYADQPICGSVNFLGSRLCQSNASELGAFEVNCMAAPPTDQTNYHDLANVRAVQDDAPRYFISRVPLQDPDLQQIYTDSVHYVYAVE